MKEKEKEKAFILGLRYFEGQQKMEAQTKETLTYGGKCFKV